MLSFSILRAAELSIRAAEFANREHVAWAAAVAASGKSSEAAASKTKERRSPRQVKREAAQWAIAALYAGGVLDQTTLPNDLLHTAVLDWLKANGFKPVSRSTILRAAGRA